ncbi:hypothetical protein CEXT_785041 [Caerostris extrusa]|uniref:LAGLIDADG homing endonuclease n=1 Tax=Caerostris extrusa TaxID=172846 RepID=A0AAV4QE95_CAEEX|nr:hypothetical protein CEXT_785041 [Caerostris extrusa]
MEVKDLQRLGLISDGCSIRRPISPLMFNGPLCYAFSDDTYELYRDLTGKFHLVPSTVQYQSRMGKINCQRLTVEIEEVGLASFSRSFLRDIG